MGRTVKKYVGISADYDDERFPTSISCPEGYRDYLKKIASILGYDSVSDLILSTLGRNYPSPLNKAQENEHVKALLTSEKDKGLLKKKAAKNVPNDSNVDAEIQDKRRASGDSINSPPKLDKIFREVESKEEDVFYLILEKKKAQIVFTFSPDEEGKEVIFNHKWNQADFSNSHDFAKQQIGGLVHSHKAEIETLEISEQDFKTVGINLFKSWEN